VRFPRGPAAVTGDDLSIGQKPGPLRGHQAKREGGEGGRSRSQKACLETTTTADGKGGRRAESIRSPALRANGETA